MQGPPNRRFGRLRAWALRYAPLEAAALLSALGAGLAVSELTESRLAIGYAGAWGENLGYYLVAFVRERRVRGSSALALRDLVLEFGLAEAVDSFVVRPLCMGYGVGQLGDAAAGVVIGKFVADIPFYGFAILGYELRKKLRP
ncbi:MAG: hypothetical protein IPK00_19325 [Deltaproteobacteria bacterium]|nr:hypothetical protein [Deltaproteobacteria bacterium]